MEELATQESAQSMDETIADAWKEITERGNEDEFVEEKETLPEEATVEEQKTEEPKAEEAKEEEEEPKPVKKAPNGWTKTAKAEWEKLPPQIQDEVLKRENDFHKGVEGYKQAAQRATYYDRAIEPFMPELQRMGVEPATAIQSLLSAEKALRFGSPSDKVRMAAQIIRDYGINPEEVFSTLQGQPPVNPELEELRAQVLQMRAEQQRETQAIREREHAALHSEIAQFSQGKEHFETLRDPMAALLQTGQAKDLNDAYQKALRLNDELWNAEQAKQRQVEQAELMRKAKEAKRAASVNVQPRGVVAPKSAIGSMNDTILDNARRLGLA